MAAGLLLTWKDILSLEGEGDCSRVRSGILVIVHICMTNVPLVLVVVMVVVWWWGLVFTKSSFSKMEISKNQHARHRRCTCVYLHIYVR